MARTHGRISTYRQGCRCDECRAARLEKARHDRGNRTGPDREGHPEMCPVCGKWYVNILRHDAMAHSRQPESEID